MSDLRDGIKKIVHRMKFTCTIPNEDFDEIISLCQPQWISVETETPKPETEVMVCVEDNTFWWGVYYETADQWYVRFGKDWTPSDCITHWQPLPEIPNE